MLARIAVCGVVPRPVGRGVDPTGAAVMQTLLRRWFELLSPQQVVMAYGMTENLGLAACAVMNGSSVPAASGGDS